MNKIELKSNGLDKNQIIEFKKKISKMRKTARSSAKHGNCMLCGKEVDSFCNSHCIPQMCLKNIDTNGILGSIFSIIDNDIIDSDSGVKNAGVFFNICHECDNTMFQTYENPQSYNSNIINNLDLLNQIALKDALRDIYKHEMELEFYKQISSEAKQNNADDYVEMFAQKTCEAMIEARKLDIEECKLELDKCKKFMVDKKPWLKVITYESLDYKVPVAFQGMIALVTGFDGETINNKYYYNADYRLEYIHMAILPFENKSIIILFTDQSNKRYDKFIKKMNSYSKTKRIQVINYILFLCCEDYYFSKNLSKKTIDKIKEIASTIEDSISLNSEKSQQKAIIKYNLKKAWSQVNILGIHA